MAKIKVSQSTIDAIKKMGMTKALAGASKATPEMKEALTRMYGARRVSASTNKTAPASKSPDAARAKAGMAKPMVAKSPDAARKAATKTSTVKAPMKKKSGTTDPFAKAVFGAGRAVGRVLSGQEAADRLKKAKAANAAAKNK